MDKVRIHNAKQKRIYEKAEPADGYRVLIDRIWPRGVSKEDAAIDLWLKEIAPSTDLRMWFGHDQKRWEEFRQRYFKELDANPEVVDVLREKLRRGPVTLVFSARDEENCNAAALRDYLKRTRRKTGP